MISPLGDLLARYKARLRAPVGTVVDAFITVAAEHHITLTKKQCSYNPHSRTLTVEAGLHKTEVALKKGKLLNALRITLGEQNCPKDIL